jgi:ArsR family transcriptional regulator
VLSEVHRALRPGGRLLLVDLLPHDRIELRERLGHVWLGFSEEQVRKWLEEAGFARVQVRALAPDPDARGPALFAATAIRDGGPEVVRETTGPATATHQTERRTG